MTAPTLSCADAARAALAARGAALEYWSCDDGGDARMRDNDDPYAMSGALWQPTAAGAEVQARPAPETAPPPYTFSSDLALVSDYRIGGVTSTSGQPALQGEMDVDGPDGWSAGVWASNITQFAGSNIEVDIYGSKSFELGATELSVGATAIYLPGGENIAVGIATASVARPIGPVDTSLTVRYAWPQDKLGGEDDFYLSLTGKTPIGKLAGVPITVGASIGYEEGVFAVEASKTDWSLSATAHFDQIDIGVSYVDTSLRRGQGGDPACIFSITRSF